MHNRANAILKSEIASEFVDPTKISQDWNHVTCENHGCEVFIGGMRNYIKIKDYID